MNIQGGSFQVARSCIYLYTIPQMLTTPSRRLLNYLTSDRPWNKPIASNCVQVSSAEDDRITTFEDVA